MLRRSIEHLVPGGGRMAPPSSRQGAVLRAVHVLPGLEVAHGGPAYSVPRLCQTLGSAGIVSTLLSVDRGRSSAPVIRGAGCADRRFAQDYRRVPVLAALRMSSGLSRALRDEVATADLVHNHGLWLMPNVEAGNAARRHGKPLIVTPRGMLAPAALAFSRRRKWMFWHLLQAKAFRDAACFHATSQQEYEEIRGFGVRAPVAIIPNGIDVPASVGEPESSDNKVVLSLGRIHPKKGLDGLLHAWARLQGRFPDWRLRIIGPSEAGYGAELHRLAGQLGLRNVSIEPPIFGDEKHRTFRDAEVFVLPSLNENFGLTIAESLASGTPVISTKGTPWSGLETERCGWWIDHGIDPLAAALERAMSLPKDELRAMGLRGREWMARDFGWEAIASKMIALYSWVVQGGSRPAFVLLD